MYIIRQEKKEKLMNGRTATYIAEVLGRTKETLYAVLNGKNCSTLMAKALISIKEQIPINDSNIEKYLLYYFKKK